MTSGSEVRENKGGHVSGSQLTLLGSNVEVVSKELETGAPGRISCMCEGPEHGPA